MMDSTYLMMRHFEWKKGRQKKRSISKNTPYINNNDMFRILPGDTLDFSKIFPEQYDESKKMFYENNLHRYAKPSKSCLRNSKEK